MSPRGGRPPKLDPARAAELRRQHASGVPVPTLARQFGLSESSARRYIRHECRTHGAAA